MANISWNIVDKAVSAQVQNTLRQYIIIHGDYSFFLFLFCIGTFVLWKSMPHSLLNFCKCHCCFDATREELFCTFPPTNTIDLILFDRVSRNFSAGFFSDAWCVRVFAAVHQMWEKRLLNIITNIYIWNTIKYTKLEP